MLALSPILLTLSCFISIAWAGNGCNDAMLKMRIKDEDVPKLLWVTNQVPTYTITQHCRAHSSTNPIWLSSTIIALMFTYSNNSNSHFALLHYTSCNETSGNFNAPIILINTTMYQELIHHEYITNNTDADFCHACVNDTAVKFCESCNSSCRNEATNDLDYCYGPLKSQCCNYIQDDNCVLMCNDGYYPDAMSSCKIENICMHDMPCDNGDCEQTSPNSYKCICPDTHLGTNCSIPNPCNITKQCNDNGNCTAINSEPYFQCNCIMGVEGSNCEINKVCNVSTNPCMNGGNCTSIKAEDYMCDCMPGFTGKSCQISTITAGSPVTAIAVSLIVLIIVITIIVVIVVVICVVFFYLKRKRGKADIAKKTSKVYPSSGNGTVDEKAPILEKEKV